MGSDIPVLNALNNSNRAIFVPIGPSNCGYSVLLIDILILLSGNRGSTSSKNKSFITSGLFINKNLAILYILLLSNLAIVL
ncbi:CPXV119A protein [Cowpox virus]|uniref:CPXV119A protein n=3 Tax=Orthopoxvirus TaxID=10242 RepID=U5TM16_COWPX|nr:hypothetical protein m8127R [Vaccinia virus]AGZ00625.1 CPXV119A protein [Cowpox virus]BBD06178.1 putative D ORF B [BAC cloning vector pLC16m8.8S-BAC]AAW23801.1 hypothetical protein mO127R [Vaccinia virus]AGZ01468.1 CPXV119A protein [Cowpox virus]